MSQVNSRPPKWPGPQPQRGGPNPAQGETRRVPRALSLPWVVSPQDVGRAYRFAFKAAVGRGRNGPRFDPVSAKHRLGGGSSPRPPCYGSAPQGCTHARTAHMGWPWAVLGPPRCGFLLACNAPAVSSTAWGSKQTARYAGRAGGRERVCARILSRVALLTRLNVNHS